ncbi:MAG TPA: thioredoxin family protein [Chloroflexi bacterium]|jgi:disulfide oxidoreductase YuzD|nr:thioredoxin family protein [Chloroflexota bacterium]
MIQVKIFGTTPPCAKCTRAEREANRAAERFPGRVNVQKLDALGPEAETYGVIMTPTVVLNDEVIATGKVVPADQLADRITTILGA